MGITYWKILAAVLSRLIFTVHGFLLVWQVVEVKKNTHYWMLVIGLLLLYLEMVVTLTVTRRGEWKWFCPMVFLYLTSVIPSVFLLELDFLQMRTLMSNSSTNEVYLTQVLYFKPSFQWLEALEQVMILVLVIGRWLMPKGEMSRDQLSQLLLIYIGLGADILDILLLIKEPSVEINWNVTIVALCLFSWATLQFTLVLTQTESSPTQEARNEDNPQSSRNKDNPQSSRNEDNPQSSRNEDNPQSSRYEDNPQSSRNEDNPQSSRNEDKPQSSRNEDNPQSSRNEDNPQSSRNEDNPQSSPGKNESCSPSCRNTEIWSLLIAVGMQDGPFLIFRLYLAIKERVLNDMMIFFICKNILTVTVEIYRIAVVQCANSKYRKK